MDRRWVLRILRELGKKLFGCWRRSNGRGRLLVLRIAPFAKKQIWVVVVVVYCFSSALLLSAPVKWSRVSWWWVPNVINLGKVDRSIERAS